MLNNAYVLWQNDACMMHQPAWNKFLAEL